MRRQKERNDEVDIFEVQVETQMDVYTDTEGDFLKAKQEFGDLKNSVLIGAKDNRALKYEDFQLKLLLGKGTFGKVFLAELEGSSKQYAVKVIRKDVLIDYNQIKNTQLEKDILFSCEHPFLVGMEYLF